MRSHQEGDNWRKKRTNRRRLAALGKKGQCNRPAHNEVKKPDLRPAATGRARCGTRAVGARRQDAAVALPTGHRRDKRCRGAIRDAEVDVNHDVLGRAGRNRTRTRRVGALNTRSRVTAELAVDRSGACVAITILGVIQVPRGGCGLNHKRHCGNHD